MYKSHIWKVIRGENPVTVIGNMCEFISKENTIMTAYDSMGGLLWVMAELLAVEWCLETQRNGCELAKMEEGEMRQEADYLKSWVKSEYPSAYYMINGDDIENYYYEGILTIAIKNMLFDGIWSPIEELPRVMLDKCDIDLYEILENEGEDSVATAFEEWVIENHPQIYSRILEYQITQDKNVFANHVW